MSKPLPIIHLSRPEDHARLVRALYGLGYTYCYEPLVELGLRAYLRDTGSGKTYPWLGLETGAGLTAYQVRDHAGMHYTTVNSISHFLAYTRSLGAPQLADAQDDTDDDYDFCEVGLDGN